MAGRVGGARRGVPELVAGVVAALSYCLGQVLAGRFPFGPQTRSVNDYGTQLVPQYAHLRDVLTGQATGDLWFTWQSALGVPYLPDVGVYMSSPLSLLVVLFPRDQIDLAAFVIHLLHLALAGSAMTWYLRRIGDGSWVVASALGAAYAVCGWAVDDAGYLTIWLPGLIAFPLIALAGEWAITSQRAVLAPLLVALPWYANFYTAYMATIGAGLLVLCRLLVLGWNRRDTLRAAVRVAWTFGLGVLLSAPLLVPVWAANNLAQPSGSADLTRADLLRTLDASPGDTLARLLPATEGVGLTPGLFVTTPVLLLALTLPWNRRLTSRARDPVPRHPDRHRRHDVLGADAHGLARVRPARRQPLPAGLRPLRAADGDGVGVAGQEAAGRRGLGGGRRVPGRGLARRQRLRAHVAVDEPALRGRAGRAGRRRRADEGTGVTRRRSSVP